MRASDADAATCTEAAGAHVEAAGVIRVVQGDCRLVLPTLPSASVQCCVTSPPYFGLRDYGVAGQIGLEASPDAYVAELVAVFREVRRVLRDDGVLFLNLGDSYSASPPGNKTLGVSAKSTLNGINGASGKYRETLAAGHATKIDTTGRGGNIPQTKNPNANYPAAAAHRARTFEGIKPKDLIGIPWLAAFALRADGWWLRSDIIWAKPNPMPESVTDRPTSAHEHIFLLTKSARYLYDSDAVRQPLSDASYARLAQDIENQTGSTRANGGAKTNGPMKAVRFGGNKGQGDHGSAARRASGNEWDGPESANLRNVWTIATQPYSGAHFATFPPELAERCVKAGSRPGDTILDPFSGAGTTCLVADRLGRDGIGIELNPAYSSMAHQRVVNDCPLFAEVAAQ